MRSDISGRTRNAKPAINPIRYGGELRCIKSRKSNERKMKRLISMPDTADQARCHSSMQSTATITAFLKFPKYRKLRCAAVHAVVIAKMQPQRYAQKKNGTWRT